MEEIKTIKTIEELKELFNFLSETLYNDAQENNEHYYNMGDRYEEMKEQFNLDKEFLMYIKKDDKIIAGITAKGMNLTDKKITIGVLAVAKDERKKGLARKLIEEFETRCQNKGIKHIDLGARFRACKLYEKLGYKSSLMVQVFDFATIEDVKKANVYKFEENSSWQGETYGFIFFKTPDIKKEYVDCFENKVKTAHAQFIFEKDLF